MSEDLKPQKTGQMQGANVGINFHFADNMAQNRRAAPSLTPEQKAALEWAMWEAERQIKVDTTDEELWSAAVLERHRVVLQALLDQS